jgi:hypothetical protein
MFWYQFIHLGFGLIWFDFVWYDLIWFDMIWYDLLWFDMIWYDLIWFYMIWYDLIWFNMIWYDLKWFDMFLSEKYLRIYSSRLCETIWSKLSQTDGNFKVPTCVRQFETYYLRQAGTLKFQPVWDNNYLTQAGTIKFQPVQGFIISHR